MVEIYRVCTLSKLEEQIEAQHGINLPGWRNSFTGFWTTSLDDAVQLKRDRDNATILYCGGGLSWSKIVATDINNVILGDGSKYKTGHEPKYDKKEIFVLKIKDEGKIKILDWEKLSEKVLSQSMVRQ